MELTRHASNSESRMGVRSNGEQHLRLNPGSTIVLLEDSSEQIVSIRRIVERLGFLLFAASDWETAAMLADCGAQFFILDIKLGDSPERVKGGLDALQVLRAKYEDEIFVAVLTALKQQHSSSIKRLRADIAIDKSSNKEVDIQRILLAWDRWRMQPGAGVAKDERGNSRDLVTPQPPHELDQLDVEQLFPSDTLALQIAGASENDLVRLLRERRRIARALGERLPTYDDLVREIGSRMRAELRGALREMAEQCRLEGRSIDLTSGSRLAGPFVRFILRFLPITYGGDEILGQLREELLLAAQQGLAGEWGEVRILDGGAILSPTQEDADVNH